MATSLDPIRKALARRAANRTTTVRDGAPLGAGGTAAHRPFELPTGVCLYCGATTATDTAWRPLPSFPRGVTGSTCPPCADTLAAHDDALVPFVTSALAAAFPDRSALPGHLVRQLATGLQAAAADATWAGHCRTWLGRHPTFPPPNTTRWGHCDLGGRP